MHADSANPPPVIQSTAMTEAKSSPRTTASEYFLRVLVVVVGIAFGVILAVVIGFATGMLKFQIPC